MVSVRETDRSSPHDSVSCVLHARDCCGRVVRSRRLAPSQPTGKTHSLVSVTLPLAHKT